MYEERALFEPFSNHTLAFEAIGHIAGAVGSEMKTFLDPIMANIKEGLQQKG